MTAHAERLRARRTSQRLTCRLLPTALIVAGLLFGGQGLSSIALAQNLRLAKAASTQTVPSYVPDEILVRFREGVSGPLAKGVHARIGARMMRRFQSVDGLQVVKLPPGVAVKEAIKAYRQDSDVLYAEPNFIYRAHANPNDPRFAVEQWNLQTPVPIADWLPGGGIDAVRAWDTTTGSSEVVVAVFDTGIDYRHPDLAANMFRNTSDCDADNVDDDHNGYVDDCHGIDTFNHDSDPRDDDSHGTAVAGIIGAVGNNGVGIAGVNWNVRLMPCKWINNHGYGLLSGVLECFDYVANWKDRGANIVATNNSWGGPEYSQALFDAIQKHLREGILCVAAAGNEFADLDYSPFYPAKFFLPNMIAVAASDSQGGIAVFSNYGPRSVHLRAPGEAILTTLPNLSYGYFTGTSASTPHVAGVAALLKAENPARDWKAIRNLILAGGDRVSNSDWVISGKKLNAYGSMHCSDSEIYKRLRPFTDSAYSQARETGYVGLPYDLMALHINCDQPAGEISVRVDETSESFSLADDGVAPDQVSGDGIYSAGWIPPAGGTFRFVFPYFDNWDNPVVSVLDNYNFEVTPYNYRDITGTSLGLATGGVVRIPENFYIGFGGLSFGDIYVGENGVISISSPYNAALNHPIPSPWANILIAPLWDDLYPVAGTAQNVFYEILAGESGRELVIEWRDLRHAHCPSEASSTVKFQVVLFEYRSEILFNYADTQFGGGCAFADHGGTATVGIQVGPQVGRVFSFETQSLSDNSAILWKLPRASLVNPSSLTFFDTRVGTEGDVRHVQVANPSTVALNVSGATSTGDFTASLSCPGPISRGNWCNITVTFLPTTAGPRSGTLTITDDSPQSPHTIPLTGNGYDGVGPVAVPTPSSWDFGGQVAGTASPPRTITLMNSGDAGLGIKAINVSTSIFHLTHDCGSLPVQLPAGGSCSMHVTFDAMGVRGSRQGSIEITNTAASSPLHIPLSGTVLAPEPQLSLYQLTFPDQPAGMTSSPQTATLSNVGDAPLVITSVKINSGGDSYSFISNCGSQLDPGSSCNFDVTFKPHSPGDHFDSLVIANNSTKSSLILSLRATGLSSFALTTDTPARTITKGTPSTTFPIQVTNPYGYTGSITFDCSGYMYIVCSANPPTIQPGQNTTVTVAGLADVPADRIRFSIRGRDEYWFTQLPLEVLFAEVEAVPSSTSLAVKAGGSAAFDITLTPVNGFDQPLALGCLDLPKESSCVFDPPSVTPDGVNPAKVSVRINTTARSMTAPPTLPTNMRFGDKIYLLLVLSVLLLLAQSGAWRRVRPAVSAALLLTAMTWAACGGGGGGGGSIGSQRGTPAGTYLVTVRATSGTFYHAFQVTLKVN